MPEERLESEISFDTPITSPIMIIGAMKSGTSTLFEMLSQHPAICPSRAKEPEFFSNHQSHGMHSEDYESLFDYDPSIHAICLEASTGYSKYPSEINVPKRISEYGLNPLFIYSVRNPFDRIESEYNFAYLNQKKWANFEILDLYVVFRSMYYLQLREFINWFPDTNRYFVVDFEDIVSKPSELANRIFRWANLQEFKIEVPEPQTVTPPRSYIEQKLMNFSQLWYGFVSAKVRKKVKHFLRENDTPAKRTLNEEEKTKLRRWLQIDMNRFQNHFEFPVSKWGF